MKHLPGRKRAGLVLASIAALGATGLAVAAEGTFQNEPPRAQDPGPDRLEDELEQPLPGPDTDELNAEDDAFDNPIESNEGGVTFLHPDTPRPGRWELEATLRGRRPLVQRHTGILDVADRCGRTVILRDIGARDIDMAVFGRDKAGEPLTGSFINSGCGPGDFTHYTLDVVSPRRMEGSYTGTCETITRTADVVWRHVSDDPKALTPPMPPDAGTLPEEWDVDRPDAPVSEDILRRQVEAALEINNGGGIANFNDYAWFRHRGDLSVLNLWLTADDRLRRNQDALPDGCEVEPGSLEPARGLLQITVDDIDSTSRQIVIRRVDVETGVITHQADDYAPKTADGTVRVMADLFEELQASGAGIVLAGGG